MGPAHTNADHDELAEDSPAIAINITKLQPLEIVMACRYVHNMPLDGFPAFDQLADELEQQLERLPQIDLAFAREVYGVFATSPYPADRLNVGLILRQLTLVDHDSGFALWHQLVRDEHPTVRRDVYRPIYRHLTSTERSAEQSLSEEGLTLADGHQLRDAFIGAQYPDGCYVIDQTPVAEALREATRSFVSIARV
jgi:hypothetical protein